MLGRALLAQRGAERFVRLRAIVVGGLVLGIGSSLTLAAWDDASEATAEFRSGTFGIVGSVDGMSFVPDAEGAASELSFSMNGVPMDPGATAYALFSLKTVNPSVGGTVVVEADEHNIAGLGSYMTYGIRAIENADGSAICTATTFENGMDVVPPGSQLTRSQTAAGLPLAADGTSAINYCIAITLPEASPSQAQGQTVVPGWTFAGASVPW